MEMAKVDVAKLTPAPWVDATVAWNVAQREYYERNKKHYHGAMRGARKMSSKYAASLVIRDNYQGEKIDFSRWVGAPDWYDFTRIIAISLEFLFPGNVKSRIVEQSIESGYFEESADRAFIAIARNAFDGDPEALAWWEANRRRRESP